MKRSFYLLAIATVATSLQSQGRADEIWTYHFIADGSRPYRQSCGECALQYSDTRADVAGTFRILLNWSNGIGKLLDLDDQLVNVAYASYSPSSGITLQPANPPYRDYGIIPPYSLIQSPLLAGRFNYQNGVGHLISDPSGFGLSYDITFGLNQASLNIVIPIIDNYITVTNAPATISGASIAGDQNRDGRVDPADYILWRKTAGPQSDYNLWRTYFGTTTAAASSSGSIPEPSTALLATLAAATLFTTRARKRRVLASRAAIN